MEVRVGYKLTEVGVIPKDWEVTPLGKLFAFTNGVNADKMAYGQGVRFINVLEPIKYSHIYGPEIPGRVEISSQAASAYSVRRGDIVFNRTSETDSELGLAAVYVGVEQVVFGGFVIRARPIDDTLDPIFSGYALRAKMIRSQIIPMGQGAIRANIGQQNLRRVLAAVPSKPEQRAIAAALSDVDSLLSGLEQLIAKKLDLKQAVMQQLLSGQKRLPDFKGEWPVKQLRDFATIATGNTPSTSDASNYGDEFLFTTPADLGKDKYINRTEKRLSKKGFEVARRFPKGSVLFVCIGSTIGKCGIASDELTSNQQINAIFPSPRFSSEFLYYALGAAAPGVRSLAGEQAVPIVNKKLFSETRVPFPPAREQDAIAAVLSDMDAELARLEARRDKTRALKQAMMQELLVGRTRLVQPATTHA